LSRGGRSGRSHAVVAHPFASWTGTALIDAPIGQHIRHRLSGAGNRRMNHVPYMAGIVQLRNDAEGRCYYQE
jgi:transposase